MSRSEIVARVAAFMAAATSKVLHDRVECHAPRWHTVVVHGLFGKHLHLYPWRARYWTGAWVTSSGHIIRAYLDEILMDEVREARR